MRIASHFLSILFVAILTGPSAFSQVQLWDGGGDGATMTDPDNWDTDTLPSGPNLSAGFGSSISVSVGGSLTIGKGVQADGTGVTVNVDIGSGDTLTIDNPSGAGNAGTLATNTDGLFSAGGWASNGATLNLNVNGGTFTGNGSGTTSGGGIYGAADGSSDVAITIASGVMEKFGRLRARSGMSLDITGGVFRVNDEYNVARANEFDGMDVTLSGSGELEFTIFDETDYYYINGITGNSLDLSGGTITFNVDPGYTPQAGDSFDLIEGNGSFTIGAAISTDLGGTLVTWDTSQWASEGKLTVDSVVPEPGSVALLGMAALTLLLRRRVTS